MENSAGLQVKEAIKVDPSNIMQVGMGFWASKTLLTAVKLELFTLLAVKPLTGREVKLQICLNGRGLYDFLDTLVALGFLQKNGNKETAVYSNSPDSDLFLDKNKLSYMGGLLEMANNRLYPFWNFLEEGLRRGTPQNEIRTGEASLFEKIYSDIDKTREFVNAMSGAQAGNFIAFATQFDFSTYNSMCDIGGAGAQLSAQVVSHNPHMKCISFDLPPVSPIAFENVSKMGVSDKVDIKAGDFFTDSFPKSDVITMGNILHDWGTDDKKMLIGKAYEALPEGGALVVIENIIDDERRENAFGLMMSLNMLIETAEGYDFTAADFKEWATEAGFTETSIMRLTGPASAVIAIK
ncbi:MAG: methyltransferase [Bacteroidetes bacterium]|nr:MAG: methyltransferase [Bacteroidota bacterium]